MLEEQGWRRAPTRHLGANKGYALKKKYFTIKIYTLHSEKNQTNGVQALETTKRYLPYFLFSVSTYLSIT